MGRERFLILCKTYPSPSARYNETSCVAAMREDGRLIRLFPIPFRLLEDSAQFSKWQWIEAVTKKAKDDLRIESYKISVDTIRPLDKLDTLNNWNSRYFWLEKLKCFNSFNEIDLEQQQFKTSIALLQPKRIAHLEIVPTAAEWTAEEKEKLLKDSGDDLFSDGSKKPQHILQKLPYDFYYHYICTSNDGAETSFKHKIVDWEVGALYWNCVSQYKDGWEAKFREQLEIKIPSRNLYFLMGNIHRWQNQWLIISLIYPPKRTQLSLF